MTARNRKLAAILAADIAGYSALMAANEETTVRDLKGHQAVVLPLIAKFGGRVIDTAGDGILAEFGSVVNAVECALAIQKTMAERNATVDSARRMQFRIGINLGDIIHDDTRIYGDGVNIAARLEAIAQPGGICLSGEAFGQVQRRLSLNAVDLGDHQLKNIEQPVRVYRIACGPVPNASQIRPGLSLPDKPSIAVLPFTNLSGDQKEDYFSDGITEDIITELSRFSELFVIARNSSFTYKGKAVDVRQVGRELGVRYVLEGSIRRAGERVRITAQLIDATTGTHRWAERYDREREDVFAVQDEVARTIVTILAIHVTKAEAERALLKPPASWQSYDFFLRASETFNTFLTTLRREDLYEARRLAEHSLSADTSYARAHALFGGSQIFAYTQPFDQDFIDPAALERAYESARKAVQLDHNLPIAHAVLANVLTFKQQHDEAVAELDRVIHLNPNYTDWRFANVLVFAGQLPRVIEVTERQKRLDPFYPPITSMWLGAALHMMSRYAEAAPHLREAVLRAPAYRAPHIWSAINFAQLGLQDDARREAAEVLRIDPSYRFRDRGSHMHIFKNQTDIEHLVDGLHKAGLPE